MHAIQLAGCFHGFCCEHTQLEKCCTENKAHLNIQHHTEWLVFWELLLSQKGLTLGLVSTTYMKSLRGLDLKMASSICSSSRQRALKPDRGWLLRQMAAWQEVRGTQAHAGTLMADFKCTWHDYIKLIYSIFDRSMTDNWEQWKSKLWGSYMQYVRSRASTTSQYFFFFVDLHVEINQLPIFQICI